MHYEKDIEGRREKLVIFHMKLNMGGGGGRDDIHFLPQMSVLNKL